MEATICRTSIAMHACGSIAAIIMRIQLNTACMKLAAGLPHSSLQGCNLMHRVIASNCSHECLHVVSVLDSMHVRAL